jgi:hypothetical protein
VRVRSYSSMMASCRQQRLESNIMPKMLQTIWKFPLAVTELQTISVPASAKALHLAVQNGTPCVWVLLDPNAPRKQRDILCFGTGNEVLACADRYIGTVLIDGFVWHYFWG